MATFIANTVDVTVTYDTSPTTTVGLETPLILIPHNLTTTTYEAFTSTDDVTDLGAATNSPMYKLVNNIFSGANAPDVVKVGRLALSSIEVSVDYLPEVGEDVGIYANYAGDETLITYTVETGDTVTEVATALATDLADLMSDASVSSSAGVITISQGTATVDVGYYTTDSNLPHVSVTLETSDTYVSRLSEIEDEDSDYFYLLASTHEEDDIMALAAATASRDIMYITSTSDADTKDSAVEDNLLTNLQALSYKKTHVMYSSFASLYPEAAIVGYNAGIDPYTPNTLNLCTLVGIPVETDLTTTQRITLNSRNGNYYHTEGGESVYKAGVNINGDFFDTIRFGLWMGLTTTSTVFALMKSKSNSGTALPYSDKGAAIIEARIQKNVIQVGTSGGAILTGTTTDSDGNVIDLNPVIDVSTRGSQTDSNISNRIWDNITVEVVYAGAIHQAKINCYVILNRDAA